MGGEIPISNTKPPPHWNHQKTAAVYNHPKPNKHNENLQICKKKKPNRKKPSEQKPLESTGATTSR